MRKLTWLMALGVVATGGLAQTVINGGRTVKGTLAVSGPAGTVDFSQAVNTTPAKSGTALPVTCPAGAIFFKTDAAAGQNLYFCTATNTWTQMTGGGGGGTDTACTKYTVTTGGGNWLVNGAATGAVASATAQNVTLFTLLASAQITALRIKQSTAFRGTGITAVTLSAGTAGTPSIYAPAFDVYQAAGSAVFYDDGGAMAADTAAHAVVGRFSSVGGNLTALGTGSVDIWACVRVLP